MPTVQETTRTTARRSTTVALPRSTLPSTTSLGPDGSSMRPSSTPSPGSVCWEALTDTPGEVAAEEGLEVAQQAGDLKLCGAACEANPECNSFASCDVSSLCWLKDRAVRKGDPHVQVGAGCQTFVRVECEKGVAEQFTTAPPAESSTSVPPAPTQTPSPDACWEALTSRPGEVAAVEGSEVGQHVGDPVMCGEACSASTECSSFARCPAFGNTCWLKDRAVRKGDPHVFVGGECQTFVRVDCDTASRGTVPLTSRMPAGTDTTTSSPLVSSPLTDECWGTLTNTPGDVATEEGSEIGQHLGDATTCAAACDTNEQCNSFARCSASGNTCWLKDQAVRRGDPHVHVGASCQTFIRMACSDISASEPRIPSLRLLAADLVRAPRTAAMQPVRHGCWEALTDIPGEVAADEGTTIGQFSGDEFGLDLPGCSAGDCGSVPAACGAACDATEGCHSFAMCPASGRTCWLKDRKVHKGDASVTVGGRCQTFVWVGLCKEPTQPPRSNLPLPMLLKQGDVRKYIM